MQFTPELIIFTLLAGLSLLLNLVVMIWLSKVAGHYNSLTKGIEQKTLMNALQGIQNLLPNTKEFRASSSPELAKTKKTPSSTFKI
jgi:hypothetical protein